MANKGSNRGRSQLDTKAAITDELADELFVLTCLPNDFDIDLTEAARLNLDKKTNRDKNRYS